MSSSLRRILVMATVAVAALGGSVVGRAQSSGAPDTLSSLLNEVRALRITMEQMVTAGPRVQLAMGRLQLQEQRVNEQARRLDGVKNKLAELQQASDNEEAQVKLLEDNIPTTTEPERRRAMEEELKHLKGMPRERAQEMLRLQGEQAALMQDLANEQTRWVDLNQRLDELERALGRK